MSVEVEDVDVSALSSPTLSFDYFSDIGTYVMSGNANILYVEAYDGAAWNNIATMQLLASGWNTYSYSLAGYTNGNIAEIRFRGESGGAVNDYYNDLLLGDKNAVLVAARILGYGKDYTFEFNGEEKTIDLTEIKDSELDESLIKEGKNEFDFKLPTSKVSVTFKLLTHGDEQAIDREIKGLKRINKNTSASLSTRMKYIITSVNGDYDTKSIRNFVDNQLLARDSRELRNYVAKIQPNVDLTFEYESKNGDLKKATIPVGLNFFWPDASV